MFPQMTLDINRAWDNEFDSYPILLTHVETVISLSHKKADTHININVEFGDDKGQIPIDEIARKAEGLNLTKR